MQSMMSLDLESLQGQFLTIERARQCPVNTRNRPQALFLLLEGACWQCEMDVLDILCLEPMTCLDASGSFQRIPGKGCLAIPVSVVGKRHY